MANKIFGVAQIPLESDYIQPVLDEGADPSTAVRFLAGYDGNDYFVYDDSVVTITTGQGDYKVNELDASDSDDKAIMDAIKPMVIDMKIEKDAVDGDLLTQYSTVELMAGIIADDTDIKAAITKSTSDKADIETKYGF